MTFKYLYNARSEIAIKVPQKIWSGQYYQRPCTKHTRYKIRIPMSSSVLSTIIEDTSNSDTPDSKWSNGHTTLRGSKRDSYNHPILRGSLEEDTSFTTISTYHNEDQRAKVDFGSDSFQIKVDNCVSRTMSFEKSDFIPGSLKKVKDREVWGFGNTISKITHIITINWKIYEDEGMLHDVITPNSYFVPTRKSRLLSPQHWSQQAQTAIH
jgi:hypothetical protein